MPPQAHLITAACVADGDGRVFSPGAVRLDEDNAVVDVGTPSGLGEPGGQVVRIHRPDLIVTPALVNAHTHLDLTDLGPRPAPACFTDWAANVRAGRAVEPDDIRHAVQSGVEASIRGGVAAVGDIAGAWRTEPFETLRDSALRGVSYLELFGQGARQPDAVARMHRLLDAAPPAAHGVTLGLQPHAPYSCGAVLYEAAWRRATVDGRPICTHLAETREELQFLRAADGPFADLLRELNVWDDTIRPDGRHPVDWLGDHVDLGDFALAHVNYAEETHIARLASSGAVVVYCPRASAYFGHHDHPWAAMLDVGVTVALGTDSILCLDTPDRMSTADEMRALVRRDGLDPVVALRMATVNGATALGLERDLFTFAPGPIAGIIGWPATAGAASWSGAMQSDAAPVWLTGPGAGE